MIFDPSADVFGPHGMVLDAVFAQPGQGSEDGDVEDCDGPCQNDEDEWEGMSDHNHRFDFLMSHEEGRLEPARPTATGLKAPSSAMEEDGALEPALRLRGGAEEGLKMKPVAVRYHRRDPGTGLQADNEQPGYRFHQRQDSTRDNNNAYAPFRSKMEWEIAKWAKLRGPSSTAFTELMAIDGVSESQEFNEIMAHISWVTRWRRHWDSHSAQAPSSQNHRHPSQWTPFICPERGSCRG